MTDELSNWGHFWATDQHETEHDRANLSITRGDEVDTSPRWRLVVLVVLLRWRSQRCLVAEVWMIVPLPWIPLTSMVEDWRSMGRAFLSEVDLVLVAIIISSVRWVDSRIKSLFETRSNYSLERSRDREVDGVTYRSRARNTMNVYSRKTGVYKGYSQYSRFTVKILWGI